MDGRKVLWLAGGILCGVLGCSRFENRDQPPGLSATPPPPPKAAKNPPSTTVAATNRDKPAKDEPTTVNAKTSTFVSIADFKAQMALDSNRPAGEQEVFAQQAKQSYRRALEQDSRYIPAWMGLATLCEGIGDRDEALNHYRTVLKVDPKHVPAHIGVARVQETMGQRDAALATYQAATAALPRETALWFEQGLCHGRAKHFDEALACLYRAAQLRPSNNEYNKSVGFMLARMGRADEALPWLTKAMPEADARYNLARMLEHIGQEQASQEQLALALKANPNHVPTLKVMSDSAPATDTATPRPENVRATAYSPAETASSAAVTQASTLPARPTVAAAPVAAEALSIPLIPVVSDRWEGKPALTPSFTSAAPPVNKEAPKPRPKPALGFEENP